MLSIFFVTFSFYTVPGVFGVIIVLVFSSGGSNSGSGGGSKIINSNLLFLSAIL